MSVLYSCQCCSSGTPMCLIEFPCCSLHVLPSPYILSSCIVLAHVGRVAVHRSLQPVDGSLLVCPTCCRIKCADCCVVEGPVVGDRQDAALAKCPCCGIEYRSGVSHAILSPVVAGAEPSSTLVCMRVERDRSACRRCAACPYCTTRLDIVPVSDEHVQNGQHGPVEWRCASCGYKSSAVGHTAAKRDELIAQLWQHWTKKASVLAGDAHASCWQKELLRSTIGIRAWTVKRARGSDSGKVKSLDALADALSGQQESSGYGEDELDAGHGAPWPVTMPLGPCHRLACNECGECLSNRANGGTSGKGGDAKRS